VGDRSYFEQAADALNRAMAAGHIGEQALLLEEALRLNRVGVAHEKAELARISALLEAT
jgi:hypothetical protein